MLQIVPAGGGYDAFLTSTVLASEIRLIEALNNLTEVVFVAPKPEDNVPVNSRMEEAEMEAAYKVCSWLYQTYPYSSYLFWVLELAS